MLNKTWYLSWWALNWEMWDVDDVDDGRPLENTVFRRIKRQAQYATILRIAYEMEILNVGCQLS